MAATWYTLGGSDPTVPGGTRKQYNAAAKPVLTDGGRIRYASVDSVGHWEAPTLSGPAKVDRRAPTTTDNVPAATQPGPVTVTLSAADQSDSGGPGSGVAVTWYTLDGSDPSDPANSARRRYSAGAKPVLGDGGRITYYSVDALGNAEAVTQSGIATVRVPAEPQAAQARTDPAPSSTPAVGTITAPTATGSAASFAAPPAPARSAVALRPSGVSLASSFRAAVTQRTGVPVTIAVPAGTNAVEVRVSRVGGVSTRKVLATVYGSPHGKPGAVTIRLNRPALRRQLKRGTFELRIRVGRSRGSLGAAVTRRFRIR